ncbi:hypothetical protein ACFYO1_12185 [Nocardia sp. NPDC006044]|uniref:hypothetical protein n=1 Tax=Nocardia sp. NPDC006044 TaxID=3364306 RepID=UPI0036CCE444
MDTTPGIGIGLGDVGVTGSVETTTGFDDVTSGGVEMINFCFVVAGVSGDTPGDGVTDAWSDATTTDDVEGARGVDDLS